VSVTCGRLLIFSGYSGFISSINKYDRTYVTEILLKVALNTITLTINVKCMQMRLHKLLLWNVFILTSQMYIVL